MYCLNCLQNKYGKFCNINGLFFNTFKKCPKTVENKLQLGMFVKDIVTGKLGHIRKIYKSKFGYTLYDIESIGVIYTAYLGWRLRPCTV